MEDYFRRFRHKKGKGGLFQLWDRLLPSFWTWAYTALIEMADFYHGVTKVEESNHVVVTIVIIRSTRGEPWMAFSCQPVQNDGAAKIFPLVGQLAVFQAGLIIVTWPYLHLLWSSKSIIKYIKVDVAELDVSDLTKVSFKDSWSKNSSPPLQN